LCLHFVEIRDSRLVVERYSLPPTSAKDFSGTLAFERINITAQYATQAGSRAPAALAFVLVSGEAQAALADVVFEPGNVRGAAFVVALVVGGKGPVSFETGPLTMLTSDAAVVRRSFRRTDEHDHSSWWCRGRESTRASAQVPRRVFDL
jgi:hypothetical protein